ncbi:hypothetical protein pEaSNUABM40_00168 [Erwinia phage pEa_SNUABM_40]|nr:hypothetical protein pEaSNUABM40_00168 [Erwinia phage pEa_SNUABM_40]UAW52948.1 hypothetical protein pEaSNUABM23_00166 [Erwinia phage pEa_SNUABM_23]UIW10844.1 hypothetical protein pEaSNUABM23_00166 [Erwinia phage pEa_SNUABM_31]
MKERLHHTLDMDTLKSEAARQSMSVELWDGKEKTHEAEAVAVSITVSNYVHPISIASHLLLALRNKLEVTNVWIVSHESVPHEHQADTTLINVTAFPRNIKETCNAS